MADKRRLHKNIKHLQVIKTWQLVILLILMLFVSATFLRLNNTGMVSRRNAVLAADKAGDVEQINARIYDLQRFVTSHMNANPGPFDLTEQYNRDVKAAMAVDTAPGANSPQARADAICNPHLSTRGYSKAYQDCMLNELTKQGQVNDPTGVKLPSPALYRYEFISPLWSPDFAGWSVLATIVIALVIVARLVILAILQVLLKKHYRQM